MTTEQAAMKERDEGGGACATCEAREERALVFKALGHPARLAVVERLGEGESCVCDLQELPELEKLSGPTVSQHLLVLKGAGLVADRREGRKLYYRLLMPCVLRVFDCLEEGCDA
ncbi:MAG: ArsR/SmtB family transcription factor [Verrucomicrobiota bacterium JB025]|nr:metalloregulator ArsR/SmtB family transcription factor [Verrucomicrobiota bacterium JB025]